MVRLSLYLAALLSAPLAVGDDRVIVPQSTMALFNGKDLGGFYTWIPETRHDDPDRVFTVVDQIDGAPAIRISGQHYGGLMPTQVFANYKLVAEFRWGAITWEPRKNRAMDSGILLHCTGEDGNADATFASPWTRSVEYQLIEGGSGDIILVRGFEPGNPTRISTNLTAPVKSGTRVWSPAGTATQFEGGRIDWEFRDPTWKDVLGFRGARDVEKPIGGWNLVEIVCREDTFEFYLNGVKVNGGTQSQLTSGRILFQSEGAELFFRKIELQPLP